MRSVLHFLQQLYHHDICLVSSKLSNMEKTKNKGLYALGALAVLVVAGMVSAYMADNALGNKTKERGGDGFGKGLQGMANLSNLNLPENATRQEIRQVVRQKAITDLGLPVDATDEQIRTAQQAKMNETQAKIDAAVQAGDYTAWKSLVQDTPRGQQLLEKVTHENFPRYSEMYDHLKKANVIAQELGLQGMGGPGMGKGMRGLNGMHGPCRG